MRKTKIRKLLPAVLVAAMFMAGSACAPVQVQDTGRTAVPAEAEVAAVDQNIYTGKIQGVSRKAKTIAIRVGKETKMLRFDDNTIGMEHTKKGRAAIITFKTVNDEQLATVITPKLPKLPAGVIRISPGELAALVDIGKEKGNYFLVDSRPASKFHEGNIPGAISIPVPKIKKDLAAVLPPDKNTYIIFY